MEHHKIMMVPRLSRIRAAAKPPCEARVSPPAEGTRSRREHDRVREERHLRPDQCGRPSAWSLDRKMLCPAHAGEAALRVLSEG